MHFATLRAKAEEAQAQSGGWFPLVLPKGMKMPPKFPRGEILCENSDGDTVKRFSAERVLKWLDWAEAQPVAPPAE